LFILPKRISELQNNVHFQIVVYIKTPPQNFMFVNPSAFSDLRRKNSCPEINSESHNQGREKSWERTASSKERC